MMANSSPNKDGAKPAASAPTNGNLDLDGPIFEIENKIKELEALSNKHGVDFEEGISDLKKQQEQILQTVVANLSPWDRVRMARLPGRPTSADYIANVFTNFIE